MFARLIERHRGRIANTANDGLLTDLPSVVEAVQCAVEVQRELAARLHSMAEPGGVLISQAVGGPLPPAHSSA